MIVIENRRKYFMASSLYRRYMDIRRVLPRGCIPFMKIGEWYETYGDMAEASSHIIGATLHPRGGTVVCEFPEKEVDTYLAKLVRCGKSVALCGVDEEDTVDEEDPMNVNVRFVVQRIVNYPRFGYHPKRGED